MNKLFTVTIEVTGSTSISIQRQIGAATVEDALAIAITHAHRDYQINADDIDEATVRRDL